MAAMTQAVRILAVWSLQIAVFAAIALLLQGRLRKPQFRLLFLQLCLYGLAILPLVPSISLPFLSEFETGRFISLVSSAGTGSPTIFEKPLPPYGSLSSIISAVVLVILGLGAIRAILILAFRYRATCKLFASSTRLFELPESFGLPSGINIFLVAGNSLPAAFGWRRPAIFLPRDVFQKLDQFAKDAVICHELIHIHRHHWPQYMLEEIILAVFWFHPVLRCLIAEIRLSREQAVDVAVVRMMGNRERYLEVLSFFAQLRSTPLTTTALAFLSRPSHIRQRFDYLRKEESMTKANLYYKLRTILCLAALMLTGLGLQSVLPVFAAATEQLPKTSVVLNTQDVKLSGEPVLRFVNRPETGAVAVELTLNSRGEVSDARILNGLKALRSTVLNCALNLHFTVENSPSAPIVATFYIGKPAPTPESTAVIVRPPLPTVPPPPDHLQIESISFRAVPEPVQTEVRKHLTIGVGDDLNDDSSRIIIGQMRGVDKNLTMAFQIGSAPNMAKVVIGPKFILLP